MPKRVQRKRTKGWRMPEGAVYVGRPSVWGNAAAKLPKGASWTYRVLVREYYRMALMKALDGHPERREELRQALGGHDLACWCPLDQPCHADVLLEVANAAA